MSTVFNILRYLALLGVVILIAGLFAGPIWNLYISIYHESAGSWIDLHGIAALMLSYALFLPLILILLGERQKKWLIALFYVPIIFFEFTTGFYGFLMFLGIGLVGLLSGWVVRQIAASTIGKMPRFEPLKKYF